MSRKVSGDHGSSFPAAYIGASQTISVSGTSAQSTAFSSSTTLIRLFSTEDCYIAMGDSPTANSSGMFLPGGIVEYVGVKTGQKLAAIRDANSGTLYVTECS